MSSSPSPIAWGVGIGTPSRRNGKKLLEVCYQYVSYGEAENIPAGNTALSETVKITGYGGGNASFRPDANGLKRLSKAKGLSAEFSKLLERLSTSVNPVVVALLESDLSPSSVEEAYLKLSLLSHRLVRPRDLDVNGLYDVLPNVAWTSEGPIDLEEIAERQLEARLQGRFLEVFAVDKIPKLLCHTVPDQVRIADGARVRLGAHLGRGTTVMQGGLVNFNSGTAGPNMVEGRLSAGVWIDSGTELGGGSSIMGTLHRSFDTPLTTGKNCLIGANAGAGISLGDNCTIEAGLYVTAGTKVELLDDTGHRVGVVRARDLSGRSNLLFRRNSQTGQVEAKESEATVQFNEALHRNR